ncbi:hypothetical protein RQP46_006571 [Phenoliferia psychrophenolica]
MSPILPVGVGYGIVIGIGKCYGFFFSGLMVLLTAVQRRYTVHQTTSATEFMSASHSVGPGLIASGIVSAWTWAATLLQSSAVAYRYGVSGPWWYGAGATVQIILFAQNAAKMKSNAPHAHTFLEPIKKRWGTVAHLTFMFFGLGANILVSAMLITGGSAVVTDLTGMSTQAACMLIPLGVILYVIVGGLRATLVADYIHTTFLYAIILTFMFTIYTASEKIGSPARMYELLVLAAERAPVAGNAGGSYLTMRSKGGLIFGVLNLCTCFSTVYLDQAYWQRIVASEEATCVKAFILGGTAWLSVPLGFATAMGLAAVALTTDPSFPGYPAPLTAAQVTAGLPAPSAAAAILGQTGGILMLVLLFLAVTSAASAELVAVSSIITYDLYFPYVNPHATEKQILFVDSLAIAFYGLFMGVLGLIFFYAGISLGYIYDFVGVCLGGAVVPVALSIMSKKANKWGCITAAWVGMSLGLIAWLVTAKTVFGELSVATTYEDYSMLAGSLASIGSGAIISVVSTLLWPDDYDFAEMRLMHAPSTIVEGPPEGDVAGIEDKKTSIPDSVDSEKAAKTAGAVDEQAEELRLNALDKSFKIAVITSVIFALILIVLVPLPLFFTSHIWGVHGFTGFVAAAFVLVFYGAFTTILYPIYESRTALKSIGSAMIRDAFGGARKVQ